jgi:uncharacterized protein YigA (DUF484 family)
MNTAIIDDHYIANWLRSNPDFFIRQSILLADLKLTSPYSHRAISLQERQLEVLREKVRALELRTAELLHYGRDNDRILSSLHRWIIELLLSKLRHSPDQLSSSICAAFGLPCAHLRLWKDHALPAWQRFADNLATPKCGPINSDPLLSEAAAWLNDSKVSSVALISLHQVEESKAASQAIQPSLGLWILGAYDERRFSAEMDTAYLTQIGELASAVLIASAQTCEN